MPDKDKDTQLEDIISTMFLLSTWEVRQRYKRLFGDLAKKRLADILQCSVEEINW